MTTPTPVDEGTPLDLEAIKARADAATPGPWDHIDHGPPTGTFMGCGQVVTLAEDVMFGDIAAPSGDCYPRSGYSPFEDMAFIAAARSDVPALVAEVSRLRSELATVLQLGNSVGRDLTRAEAERDAALKVVEAVRDLHTDSVMGVCPSCGDIGVAFSGQGDGLVNYPCPTIVAVDALDAWKVDHP